MGNYRFRLSDMMPNAWFYKLKEMGKTRNPNSSKKKQVFTASASTNSQRSKSNQPHHHHDNSCSRKSYYFTRELISNNPKSDPPRKSSKQRLNKRKATVKTCSSSPPPKLVSAGCSCRATICTKSLDSLPDNSASSSVDSSPVSDLCDPFPPEFRSDHVLAADSFHKMLSWSNSNSNDDIIIDVDKKSLDRKFEKQLDLSDLNLPPIITKPAKFNEKIEDIKKKETKYKKSSTKYQEPNSEGSLSVKEESVTMKEQKVCSSFRRHSLNSPGLRLRVNSPRIGNKKIQGLARKSVSSNSRRSLSDSLAIVKSSFDPQRDFRESMVEMIVENNISASKDLEDLLACYLSLNSDVYHDLIIKVFKQIWLDLTETK